MTLTAQQLENRSAGLGGSDTATILNLNPYKSAYELWQEKTNRVEPEDISGKFAVRRGNDMEDLVCKWFCEETGMVAHRVNKTITHPDYPYMLGHIDRRIVGVKEGLEAKTANWRVAMKFGESGTDDVPANYLIQCMHYMIVTGWRVWHLAADLGGDFRIFRIEYDNELATHIALTCDKWWTDHVINDVEPIPVTSREIEVAYPTAHTGVTVEASTEAAGIHEELKAVVKDGKELKAREDALKAELKGILGNAETLMHDGRKLATWSNQTRKAFNSKALAKDKPEIFEAYQKTSSFRVFRPNYR